MSAQCDSCAIDRKCPPPAEYAGNAKTAALAQHGSSHIRFITTREAIDESDPDARFIPYDTAMWADASGTDFTYNKDPESTVRVIGFKPLIGLSDPSTCDLSDVIRIIRPCRPTSAPLLNRTQVCPRCPRCPTTLPST